MVLVLLMLPLGTPTVAALSSWSTEQPRVCLCCCAAHELHLQVVQLLELG